MMELQSATVQTLDPNAQVITKKKTEKKIDWSNLAQVVYKRTYARQVGEGGTENWKETVERVIDGNVKKYRGTVLLEKNEEDRLFYYIYNRKAMPAGRGLWFSGSEAHERLGGAGLVNCWGTTADNIENFVMAQDLLMLGGGVGMSVEHKYVSKLPRPKKDVVIEHQLTRDATFIVPDSREGWCELLRKVLRAYFVTGEGFTYSTFCIRGKGEPIKGFGGTASGPLDLVKFIDKLSALLDDRAGKAIRPIDAADMLCLIAEMVVAGNVRRSALLILGDCWDKLFLRAKRWDLGTIPSQRGNANFSVVCDDVEDLHPEFWKSYQHGEPFGIVNRTNLQTYGRMGEEKRDTAVVVNPCVVGDTIVSTSMGLYLAEQLLGKKFEAVVDGKLYDSTYKGFFKTGNKPTVVFHLSSGRKLEVTENHEIMTPLGWTEARNLDIGDYVTLNDHKTLEIAIDKNSTDYIKGYLLGAFLGDGNVSKDLAEIKFWGKDKEAYREIMYEMLESVGWINKQKAASSSVSSYSCISSKSLYAFAQELDCLRGGKHLSKKASTGSWNYLSGLVSSYFDADGHVINNKNKGCSVRLTSTNINNLENVQIVLSAFGIQSKIYKNRRPDGVRSLPDGKGGYADYVCSATHDLIISGEDISRFFVMIGFLNVEKQEKLNNLLGGYKRQLNKSSYKDEIIDISLGEVQPVYDCTIPEVSAFDANGVYVHNCAEIGLENGEPCNLTECFLPNLESIEEFKEAARLMFRWSKRITCEDYHNPTNDKVIKKNRRVGVGITGCLQAPELFKPQVLDQVYQAIQKENTAYSKALGVPESIRTTTVKPSGTVSLVGDVTPGIHPSYSRHYIRRVTIAANDPLVSMLKESGHHLEPKVLLDGTLDHGSLIVEFPVTVGDSTPCADENFDTWKQLEVLKMAQKYWSDNSVSVTVYYDNESLPKVKEWVTQNLSEIKTISFLLHTGHGFVQAPYEPITKERYDTITSKLQPLYLEQLAAAQDVELSDCESGICPIK